MKRIALLLLFLCGSLEARMEEPWGKDVDLIYQQESTPDFRAKPSIASRIAGGIISFHQNFISPTTGPRSSYRPTSSKYMELAIKRYGFLKGFIMGCDRLLRENDEEWVYRTIEIDGITYKYDPAVMDKFSR